ncbi:MAG: MATE family efflux transporter [Candidatus Eiseniibacteriota bacterium]
MTPRNAGAPVRLVDGPITATLLRLSWPVFLSRVLHTAYGVMNTIWVGRLSPEAIAAVATSFFASWTLYAVGTMFVAGVTAVVSQAVGAGRDEEAARAAFAGAVLAAALGTAVAVLGWFGSPWLFDVLFDDPVIVAHGARYLSVISLLAPIFYVTFVFEAVFRSCGDSRTPLFPILAGTLLNFVLDPLLIFGIGPFPRLEVLGAAIATVVSELVVLGIWAVLHSRGRFPLRLTARGAAQSFRGFASRILRIGAPEAIIEVHFSVVYLVISHVTGTFGAATTAALGIVNRLESVTYLTAAALGMAVAAMVGQNLGAARADRARIAADRGAQLIGVVAGVLTLAYLLVPEAIAGFFTSDRAVAAEAALFLRIVAVSQAFMGWELVYGHAFIGAADTLPPMYVSVLTSLVRLPLVWWLAFHTGIGPVAIWWTISITGIARGTALVLWFRLGRWASKAPAAAGVCPVVPPPIAPEGPTG